MNDHPEFRRLVRAVIDEPDADIHRLICADWLEEYGDPDRAEFIRLQIAMWNECRDCNCGRRGGGHTRTGGQHHNGPCAADRMRVEVGGKWVSANARMRGLFRDSGPKWWDDLPGEYRATEIASDLRVLSADGWKFTIERGFVSSVVAYLKQWEVAGRRLAGSQPVARAGIGNMLPACREYGGGCDRWIWLRRIPHHTPGSMPATEWRHYLPLWLWDVMCPGSRSEDRFVEFDTPEQAEDALSVALLKWARSPYPNGTNLA